MGTCGRFGDAAPGNSLGFSGEEFPHATNTSGATREHQRFNPTETSGKRLARRRPTYTERAFIGGETRLKPGISMSGPLPAEGRRKQAI